MSKRKIPAILYKYFHPDRYNFFYKPMLRFTPLNQLNDPFESRPIAYNTDFSTIKSSTRNLTEQISTILPELSAKINLEDELEEIAKEVLAKINKESSREIAKLSRAVHVMCFSETNDNLLMWSHYAGQHKGFVVAFDTTHSFFTQCQSDIEKRVNLWKTQGMAKRDIRTINKLDLLCSQLSPVIYTKKRPLYQSHYKRGYNFFRDLLRTKSIDWRYEKEWRITKLVHLNKPDMGLDGLVEVPIDAIKAIYIGIDKTEMVERSAINFCKDNDIPFFDTEIDEFEFCLRFEQDHFQLEFAEEDLDFICAQLDAERDK